MTHTGLLWQHQIVSKNKRYMKNRLRREEEEVVEVEEEEEGEDEEKD